MRISCALALLLSAATFAGCMKHVPVKADTAPIIYAPDRTYAYYDNGPGDWIVVSKVGTEKAVKQLCPHGAVCTVEPLGMMYRVKRVE